MSPCKEERYTDFFIIEETLKCKEKARWLSQGHLGPQGRMGERIIFTLCLPDHAFSLAAYLQAKVIL